MKVTVYGASDDLLEVEGDISEEFGADSDCKNLISFGDGTLLSVEYDKNGIWRINRLIAGSASYKKDEGDDPDNNYSDKVWLDGDLKFCLVGKEYVKAKP